MSHVPPSDPNDRRDDPEFDRDEVIEPEPTVPTESEPTVPTESEPTPPTEPEPTPPIESETPIEPVETSAHGRHEAPELVEPPAAERAEYAPPVLPDLESAQADDVAGLKEPEEPAATQGGATAVSETPTHDEHRSGEDAPTAAYAAAPTAAAYPGVSTTSTNGASGVAAGPARDAGQPDIVYVSEPVAPKDKGNRGIGTLLAVASAIVFLVLYAAVAALIILLSTPAEAFLGSYLSFLSHPSFWLPVVVFTIAYILLVLIVNRAGWWAHVLGGFIVAVLTYLAFIGGVLLDIQAWNFTFEQVSAFAGQLWFNPFAIAAFIIAREVPIWIGAAVSARGRQVKARNALAREEFDREQARVRSEYERSYPTAT